MNILGETIAAFIGTVAFCALYNTPKKQYWICGLVGSIGWLVYRVPGLWLSKTLTSFLSAVTIVLLARILAVVRRVPTNVIVVAGLFPIVPGAGIYDMIYNIMIGNPMTGLVGGLSVLKVAGAIVLGMVVVFALPNQWFVKLPKILKRS